MPSILETLQQSLGGGVTDEIGRRIGADRTTASTALSAALPLILAALAKNTANEPGAAALHETISKNHDGSILDHVGRLIGQPEQTEDGFNILQHLFGRRPDRVNRGLSQTTGLDISQAGALLAMLAPVVLGAIGRAKREKDLDPQNLGNLLHQEKREIEQKAPREVGMLEKLLDADNDGDVDLSDLSRKGMGALGGLFGG